MKTLLLVLKIYPWDRTYYHLLSQFYAQIRSMLMSLAQSAQILITLGWRLSYNVGDACRSPWFLILRNRERKVFVGPPPRMEQIFPRYYINDDLESGITPHMLPLVLALLKIAKATTSGLPQVIYCQYQTQQECDDFCNTLYEYPPGTLKFNYISDMQLVLNLRNSESLYAYISSMTLVLSASSESQVMMVSIAIALKATMIYQTPPIDVLIICMYCTCCRRCNHQIERPYKHIKGSFLMTLCD